MSITLTLLGALLLDRLLGEPSRYHPLVGFGRWAKWVESRLYSLQSNKLSRFLMGSLSWLIVVSIPLAIAIVLLAWSQTAETSVWTFLLGLIIVYFAVAARSLEEHALAVAEPLKNNELAVAREKLGYIVSRDTGDLDAQMVSKATVETVLENSHDAVIAPMFWFIVAGIPGVLVFRMANTLDAMWGYRNQRYNYFGRWSARVDDVLGFISARLTVILFTLINARAGVIAWRDGGKWYSPNAGPVMAAGAGALGVNLGGTAPYNGHLKERPILGEGAEPAEDDISKALSLTNKSYYLLVAMVAVGEGIYFVSTAWG